MWILAALATSVGGPIGSLQAYGVARGPTPSERRRQRTLGRLPHCSSKLWALTQIPASSKLRAGPTQWFSNRGDLHHAFRSQGLDRWSKNTQVGVGYWVEDRRG